MSRLAVENYVVVGITLAVITASCQLLFLPFLFSEIDAIRHEFDVEIREAMRSFESSYEVLAGFRGEPGEVRKRREAAKNMIHMDGDTVGPADHPAHAAAAKTHGTRLSGIAGQSGGAPPSGPSLFSPELRKLAREVPAPTDDYDDEESEYEDAEAMSDTSGGAQVILGTIPTSTTTTTASPSPTPQQHPTLMNSGERLGPLPICPLDENRCPMGPPGPPGLRGTPGQSGTDGNDGLPGFDAMDEITPNFPTFCVTCPAGPDGTPGQPGGTGKPGLGGAPGILGPMGKNGQPGAPGGYGSPGKQGSMGSRGVAGNVGQDGVVLLNTKGPKGPSGKHGTEGQPGEDGTNNNTPGPIGPPGLPGSPGAPGAAGIRGKRGEFGVQGQKGVDSKECTCESLMKESIVSAENLAYLAVEAQSQAMGHQIDLKASEIRRTQQKASGLASGLPTLNELRNKYQKGAVTFAQEDSTIQKFAVAPSDVSISETEELLPASNFESPAAEKSDESTFAAESEDSETIDEPMVPPKAQFPATFAIAQAVTSENSDTSVSDPEPLDSGTGHSRPALFAPPRAQLPSQSVPKAQAHGAKSHSRGSGESKKKSAPLNGNTEIVKKTRGSGSTKRRRVVKVKRVPYRHPAFRVFSTTNEKFAMSMDEGERGFRAEKEIARESEKKVVNLREIRRSPKKLRRKLKPGKTEKKLRRVRVKPSKSLADQQRQNSNILENIAESLGLIENHPAKMSRVAIP